MAHPVRRSPLRSGEERRQPGLVRSPLEGYRQVAIELWTHAIGGLSENDFILAAKIDQLPIQLER